MNSYDTSTLTALPYAKERDLVDDVVRNYFRSVESCYRQSTRSARGYDAYGSDGISSEEAGQRAREAYALLSRARMFIVEPARYIRLYNIADQYTTEVSGGRWKPFDGTAEPESARVRLDVDEWVAVLTYWVEAYVKGPPDKPYVPAARIESRKEG